MGVSVAVFVILLARQMQSQTTAYISHAFSRTTSTGSVSAPFHSISQAISASSDSMLDLIFLSSEYRNSYELPSVGLRELVVFHCDTATLAVKSSVLVAAGATVVFDSCEIVSLAGQSLSAGFAVFGAVALHASRCSGHEHKLFLVYGVLSLTDSLFDNNRNSIIAATTFGFRINAKNCTFDRNSSPVGAVGMLSIATSATESTSELVLDGCNMRNNEGVMGGAVLYLNVNRNIRFSQEQSRERREIRVVNSHFEANFGYANLLLSKFVNSTFANNSFTNHEYGFVLQLFDSSFAITNSSISSISFLVIATHIAGQATFSMLDISDLRGGPAFLIRNSANLTLGLVLISDIELHHVHNTTVTMFTPSILAYSTNIDIRRVRVHTGQSFLGICGCYSFSVVRFEGLAVEDLMFTGAALFVLLHSEAAGADTYVRNITMTGGAMMTAYYSTLSLNWVSFDPGETGYTLVPRPRYNVCAAYDSVVSMKYGEIILPAIENYPAFYLWKSVLFVEKFSFSALFSNLINMFASSTAVISNVNIGKFKSKNVVLMSFYCDLTIRNVTAERFYVDSSLISALSYSTAVVDNFEMAHASLKSLIIASHSSIKISNISMTDLRADTLFWYISDSNITVFDLQVANSVFDLMQLTSSSIEFSRVSMANVTINRRFMTLSKSTARFLNVSISKLDATTVSPLCVAKRWSEVVFAHSDLSQFRSREQGLISSTDSTFSFIHTSITDFNATFAYAIRSNFTVSHSAVRNGGLARMDPGLKAKVTAALLDCVDCEVSMSSSRFEDLSGTSGGVVAVRGGKSRTKVRIENCEFEGNSAELRGGSVAAAQAEVRVVSSKFVGGTANSGGAIYFECEKQSLCTCEISHSRFARNSASEGGAVKWTKVRPKFDVCSNENNTATYGPFEASLATHTALLNSNNSIMRGVPGVVVVEPILIGFVDVIGQLVATDNSSSAELISDQIIGTNYLIAVNGVANFSGIIVRTTPGNAVPIEVLSASINRTYPGSNLTSSKFVYETRDCVMGEVTTEEGCYLCPKNTFSVDPTEAECRECPFYATCPGGPALILDSGYWRLSENHSDVYLCFLRDSCLGGQNSTCADGYASRLCSACAEDYYSGGLTYCFQCESVYVRIFRSLLAFFVSLVAWLLMVRQINRLHRPRISGFSLTTFKILLTHLNSLLPISLINVDLQPVFTRYLSTNEMFQSFGLSSLTIECMLDSQSTVSSVFLKSAIASGFPFLASALIVCVFCVISFVQSAKLRLSECFESLIILTYTVHTYILKVTITLVSCKSIESEQSYMLADATVECWESQHKQFLLTLFLPVVFIYFFGFPALILYLTTRTRSRRLNFFFKSGLKPDFPYWELVIFLRKTALIVLLGLANITSPLFQILSSVIFLYCFLEWSLRTEPYVHPVHNRLDCCCQFLSLSLLASTFYFSSEFDTRTSILTTVSLIAMVVLLLMCVWIIGVMIVALRTGGRIIEERITRQESDLSQASNIAPPPTSLIGDSAIRCENG